MIVIVRWVILIIWWLIRWSWRPSWRVAGSVVQIFDRNINENVVFNFKRISLYFQRIVLFYIWSGVRHCRFYKNWIPYRLDQIRLISGSNLKISWWGHIISIGVTDYIKSISVSNVPNPDRKRRQIRSLKLLRWKK